MVLTRDSQSTDFGKFKQQVFVRLAFLGMPQGDATKFVDLSMELVIGGVEGKVARGKVKKLVASLSPVLGKPRALLFVKWLVEKIPEVSGGPATESTVQPSNSNLQPTTSVVTDRPECVGSLPEQSLTSQVCPSAPTCVTTVVNEQHTSDDETNIDESWVEVKSKGGQTYFWNRTSNSCNWALPAGITVKWISQKSAEGRTYYYDRKTRDVVWVMPPMKTAASTVSAQSSPSESPQPVALPSGPPVLTAKSEHVPVLVPPPALLVHKAAPYLSTAEPDTPVDSSCSPPCSIELATSCENGSSGASTKAAPEAVAEPETPMFCPSHVIKLAMKSECRIDREKTQAAPETHVELEIPQLSRSLPPLCRTAKLANTLESGSDLKKQKKDVTPEVYADAKSKAPSSSPGSIDSTAHFRSNKSEEQQLDQVLTTLNEFALAHAVANFPAEDREARKATLTQRAEAELNGFKVTADALKSRRVGRTSGDKENKENDGMRARSRSPRRGLCPDAKLKLADKIAALKLGSVGKSERSAPKKILGGSTVFELGPRRRASIGGA